MAVVGVLTLELHIEGAHSLKDKRHLVKGLKDRLRSRHNVAVAETDFHDAWQRSRLMAVTVSGEKTRAEQVLQAVERDAAHIAGGALVGAWTEWIE
ncbi:MAG: DUF503 domain-containing protein [Acidobacteria bacterium]|nr:DUF503 domain-containing protein [Acidobacteriota bacterium]